MRYRIGIDVGGTNTDAVIVDESLQVIATAKTPTTPDVMEGIRKAIRLVCHQSRISPEQITTAMLGTTHCTNAIVERSGRLLKTGVIRIGKPAAMSIPPLTDWAQDLADTINGGVYTVTGGHEYDGREIFPLNEDELRAALNELRGKVQALAIVSVFSPVNPAHEKRAAQIAAELMPGIRVTMSHELASIGLLERENAAILNAALYGVAESIARGFQEALLQAGVKRADMYLCQNDGTLMSLDYALRYPILTIACGPTNSIRGASYLSGSENAIVLDIGGTTSDIGVVRQGFPRESSAAVNIGGVRTGFRMPDIVSIGLGGGTIIRTEGGQIRIGPDSVGYRLREKALVFGGDTLTATDIAVRLGLADIGDPAKVEHVDLACARRAHEIMMDMIQEGIDRMKLSKDPLPLIVVGGGSVLIRDQEDGLEGVSEVVRPPHFPVVNAVGAAVAQASGQVDEIYSLQIMDRDQAVEQAKSLAIKRAVLAGADPASTGIVEVDVIPLAYLGNAIRVRVKATGSLA